MEKETFCIRFCPVPFRGKFRNGDSEVDCDREDADCPFKEVDFTKVSEYGLESKPRQDRVRMSNIIYQRIIGTFSELNRDVVDALSGELERLAASRVKAECEAECQQKIEELIEEIEQAGKEGKVVIYFQSDWWQSLKAKYSNKEKDNEANR